MPDKPPRSQGLEAIRAKIAEADVDSRPSLTEAEVDRHFKERLARSIAPMQDKP